MSGRGLLLLAFIVIGIIAIVIAGFTTTYSVGVSEAGILVNTIDGSFSGPITGPTTQFFQKAPWVNLITISTSVQTITLQGNATGVFVLSKDNLEIEFDVNVRYQVSASHVIDLYKKFPGQTWQNDAIIPHIRAAFRDIVAGYPADQIQIVRDNIQSGVEQELASRIGNDTSLAHAVNIVTTQITDITLPSSFLNAIQLKLNAQQAFLQASFEASKIVLLAQAAANASIQQALGIKASQLIIANGTAQSILYISNQLGLNQNQTAALTQTYVFMQQLQALCAASNAPCQNLVLLLGSSNGTFFQIPVKPV